MTSVAPSCVEAAASLLLAFPVRRISPGRAAESLVAPVPTREVGDVSERLLPLVVHWRRPRDGIRGEVAQRRDHEGSHGFPIGLLGAGGVLAPRDRLRVAKAVELCLPLDELVRLDEDPDGLVARARWNAREARKRIERGLGALAVLRSGVLVHDLVAHVASVPPQRIRFERDGRPVARTRLTCADMSLLDAQPAFALSTDENGEVETAWFKRGKLYAVFGVGGVRLFKYIGQERIVLDECESNLDRFLDKHGVRR